MSKIFYYEIVQNYIFAILSYELISISKFQIFATLATPTFDYQFS